MKWTKLKSWTLRDIIEQNWKVVLNWTKLDKMEQNGTKWNKMDKMDKMEQKGQNGTTLGLPKNMTDAPKVLAADEIERFENMIIYLNLIKELS